VDETIRIWAKENGVGGIGRKGRVQEEVII